MKAWITFKLIQQPFTDSQGNILPFATKRRTYAPKEGNRTLGGEWIVPHLTGIDSIERYQKKNILLIVIDIPAGEVQVLINKNTQSNYAHTYRRKPNKSIVKSSETSINFQMFNPEKLTEGEYEDMKLNFFGVTLPVEIVESGVSD